MGLMFERAYFHGGGVLSEYYSISLTFCVRYYIHQAVQYKNQYCQMHSVVMKGKNDL